MTTMTMPAAAMPRADVDRAMAVLLTAFSADPVIRWVYPDAARYLRHFPELVALTAAEAFTAGTADHLPDRAGAALWVPPGPLLDEVAMADLLERSVDASRHGDQFAFLAQVEHYHPTEPHWYLPFIGVDPAYHGRGYGSALLQVGLARCDRDGLPGYLEASSPRNRALYERHGFAVIGEIRAAGSPPLWPMLRPAR